MRHLLRILIILLIAVPSAAQVGSSGQEPGTGPLPPDPSDHAPVQPRLPGNPGYGGPGDTTPHEPPSTPTPGDDPTLPPGTPPPGTPPPGATSPTPPVGTLPGGLGPPPTLGPADPYTTASLLGLDLTAWTWWWELNKEPFLSMPKDTGPSRPRTGSSGDLLGRGEVVSDPRGRPTDEVVYGKVVPALLRVLARDQPDELRASTCLALARIGASRPFDKKSAYAKVLQEQLSAGDLRLAEIAVLGLGILGDEASAPLLADVLSANRSARKALGGRTPSTRVRAFAGYALGLLGASTRIEDARRYVVHQLVWCIETDRSDSTDVQAACVNALGLIPIDSSKAPAPGKLKSATPPGASFGAQIEYLLSILDDRHRERLVRAQVPMALGRLLRDDTGDGRAAWKERVTLELLDLLAAHRREPREVMQSCVIALGQLGDDDTDDIDQRIRRTLMRIEDRITDLPTRQLALIALGRVNGRRGDGPPATLKEERAYLLKELGRGGTAMRPWAALGLGLQERGASDDPDSRIALRTALSQARSDREVGAYAIGSGLAQDPEAHDDLLAQLGERGEQSTRGHLALALGLARLRSSEEPLLELLAEARFQPNLLHDASLSLALMSCDRVIPLLVELLTGARSLSSQVAAGIALSRSRDTRAVDPLVDLLGDRGATTAARAYAAASLGWVAGHREVPWNSAYSVDANFHAAPPTLFDPLGSGILNLF